MKKITLLFLSILTISCSLKQTQKFLNSGNYDVAINKAVEALQKNKTAKGKQDYIYILEEAFAKANERDLDRINLLKKENNPANYEQIFTIYNQLKNRQEKIKPLLPLSLIKESRMAKFNLVDYNEKLVLSKKELSNYLYNNAQSLLKSNNKMDFRKAYDDLQYLLELNGNYENATTLLDQALAKGIDYVYVYTKNETGMVIPERLQNDLLDFSTYGLNDTWTVYNSNKQKNIAYDYGMIVNFRQITISDRKSVV